jgi:methylamine dehydrogenase accessory protein MauD
MTPVVTLLVIAVALLWILSLALGATVFALARQVGVLHERVAPAGALSMNQRLVAGDSAPVVATETLAGKPIEIGVSSSEGRSMLVFFLSPTCPVCKTLLPMLKSIAHRESDWCDIVLASDGQGHESFIAEHALESFAYVVSPDLGMLYGVGKLPYAALVDENGRIAAFGLVNSREHIESLFEAKERGLASIQDYLSERQHLRVDGATSTGSES